MSFIQQFSLQSNLLLYFSLCRSFFKHITQTNLMWKDVWNTCKISSENWMWLERTIVHSVKVSSQEFVIVLKLFYAGKSTCYTRPVVLNLGMIKPLVFDGAISGVHKSSSELQNSANIFIHNKIIYNNLIKSDIYFTHHFHTSHCMMHRHMLV